MAWHNDEFTHSSRSGAGYLHAHACQGDGEVCGVAVEYPTFTTSTVNVVENHDIEWPRLEADDFVMAIGSTRPLEDVCRVAYRELTHRLERDFGFERYDAYMMLSQCGKVRLGNFVDPKYTMGLRFQKIYLLIFPA